MILSAAVEATETVGLNGVVSGGVGASIVALLIWAGRLLLDRLVPSRSDARANVTLVLEGLNQMVSILQAEKVADRNQLNEKQSRINQLEDEAEKDYGRLNELRAEVIDLRNRLAQKERHIRLLVAELRRLGATVTGVGLATDEDDLEITVPTHLNTTKESQ